MWWLFFLNMILINKNSANDVIFTATEKDLLNNPYYLFEFIKDDENKYYYCVCGDASTFTYRFNETTITDKPMPNPLLGQVNLNTGYYHYNIYEQSSSTNLSPIGLNKVETGKARVIGTNYNSSLELEYTGEQITNTVYNG